MNNLNNYKIIEIWKDWKEYIRTKCEIWSRVMWYHRNVSNYNIWKKSEFYSRTCFTEEKTNNSKFNLQNA